MGNLNLFATAAKVSYVSSTDLIICKSFQCADIVLNNVRRGLWLSGDGVVTAIQLFRVEPRYVYVTRPGNGTRKLVPVSGSKCNVCMCMYCTLETSS